ncbi:MAG TPA: NifU N-terminal domain-containing protein [bacterium]|nr:NifU N-terminal domain-containing protein [bacterium]
MSAALTVTVQPTPNANALKFVLNRRVTEGRSQTFTDPATAAVPLARELLGIPGVRQVFFLNDFITITRVEGTDWDAVVPQVESLIHRHLAEAV